MSNVLRWQARAEVGARTRKLRRVSGQPDPAERLAAIFGLNADQMAADLCIILQSGVAILLSATTEGGAVSVTAYVGDEKVRGYAGSADELVSVLNAVRDEAEAFVYRQAAQNGSGPSEATSSK